MDESEYERLEGVGVVGSMTAGAMAGVAEHLVMYPVDSVKTRMQALACEKKVARGIYGNVALMVREEGMLRPLRGATVVIAGAGPAHALYFTCYEQAKKLFTYPKLNRLPDWVGHGVAGATATLFHDAIMTPAEAVKQRMQMCCSKHTRWTHCARSMLREEGGRSFFRAYTTQLSMNVPFQVLVFMTYEQCKKILNPQDIHDPKSHLISGAIAGATAAAFTNPLDVCKTLLNTQEPQLLRELNTPKIVGMSAAMRTVHTVAGFQGFFRGVRARILFQAPSTAICWGTYECFKHLLTLEKTFEDKYETLREISHHKQTGGGHTDPGEGGGGVSPAGGGSTSTTSTTPATTKLWESITDTTRPRPLKALEVWREETVESPLKYADSNMARKDI
eukprot:TRINITY_DN2752_c0_g1_i1.p1 TRINITY_DN2752_c0_g1~~TRINITY_DN2752_c0_g1_i1.p1  ORF type:complete len:391 (-),score=70.98 TRINITY_DN2752_c0_g1_i1:1766-2938(-)